MAMTIIIKTPSINHQTQWLWNYYKNVKSPVHSKTGTLRPCKIWPSLDLCLDPEGFYWSPSCFSPVFFNSGKSPGLFLSQSLYTHSPQDFQSPPLTLDNQCPSFRPTYMSVTHVRVTQHQPLSQQSLSKHPDFLPLGFFSTAHLPPS